MFVDVVVMCERMNVAEREGRLDRARLRDVLRVSAFIYEMKG